MPVKLWIVVKKGGGGQFGEDRDSGPLVSEMAMPEELTLAAGSENLKMLLSSTIQ